MTALGASGEANVSRSEATAHVKGFDPADTKSPKVMSACGIKVTKNPAEMGKLLKSVL